MSRVKTLLTLLNFRKECGVRQQIHRPARKAEWQDGWTHVSTIPKRQLMGPTEAIRIEVGTTSNDINIKSGPSKRRSIFGSTHANNAHGAGRAAILGTAGSNSRSCVVCHGQFYFDPISLSSHPQSSPLLFYIICRFLNKYIIII